MQDGVESLASRVQNNDADQPAAQPENRRKDRRFAIPGGLVRTPCKPFHVSGAELDARTLLFGVLPSLVARRYELVNISKGGLAFEASWPVRRGVTMRLQLSVPEHEGPIELVGETRWCSRLRDGTFRVGVQFAPYGRSPGMNPLVALEALRKLEATYTD